MNYEEVLELPLRVFTLYNTSINRLRAEEDIRVLQIQASINSAEAMTSTYNKLIEDLGETTTEDGGSDYVAPEEGAFDRLRSLAGLG